eukprot:5428884-Amphidinium_carterae.1
MMRVELRGSVPTLGGPQDGVEELLTSLFTAGFPVDAIAAALVEFVPIFRKQAPADDSLAMAEKLCKEHKAPLS